MPRITRSFVDGMYLDSSALGWGENNYIKMHEVTSGVLQGRPPSGSLYALAANPFLKILKYEVDSESRVQMMLVLLCGDCATLPTHWVHSR